MSDLTPQQKFDQIKEMSKRIPEIKQVAYVKPYLHGYLEVPKSDFNLIENQNYSSGLYTEKIITSVETNDT